MYKTGISQTGAFAYSFDKAKVLRCSAYCLTECILVERYEQKKEGREKIESIFITFLS